MSLFAQDDVCTCVACGCDDEHACPGGCGWVAQNLESMQGLCDACTESGKAILIEVHLTTSNRREFAAEAMVNGKKKRSACVMSPRTAVRRLVLKVFGPGAKVIEFCERYSVAVKPSRELACR